MNIPKKEIRTRTYTYDAAGNLVTLTDSENQTTTYTYDLLGRLYTMQYPAVASFNDTTTYTHDLRGASETVSKRPRQPRPVTLSLALSGAKGERRVSPVPKPASSRSPS